MKNHPKITILSFSPIHSDGRVLRQIEYLSRQFAVDVIGYGHIPPNLEDRVKMSSIKPPTGLARRGRKSLMFPLGRIISYFYELWYWSESEYKTAFDLLIHSAPDAIHANDWESLPVAIRAAQKTKSQVVIDLHEYAPLMRDNHFYWRIFYKPVTEYFLRKYLTHINASITVNSTIAQKYTDEYGIHPIVVMNTPQKACRKYIKPTDPRQIHLIHHGNAIRDRKIERMIETIALCDKRFILHLMLVDRHKGYVAKLRNKAQRSAPGRVVFHHPVPPSKIVDTIAQFDIGFYILQALSFNQLAASPNKFFDFVVAGLAVCIGPSPEMARLTRQYGFGIVADSFDPPKVASLLNRLEVSDIDQMKHCAITACSQLNANIELEKLAKLYTNLFECNL